MVEEDVSREISNFIEPNGSENTTLQHQNVRDTVKVTRRGKPNNLSSHLRTWKQNCKINPNQMGKL
jgi:hypothetical protein